jgi:clan AA aspartic protease
MGLIYADISLSNPKAPDLERIEARALVDTGATGLCLPQHIAVQLRLDTIEQREVTTADGTPHVVPYAGPVQVNFRNRTCFTGAFVFGDGVLLGAIPMEDMDLVVEPSSQEVKVNPKSPNIPSAIVKSSGWRR